MRFDTVNLVTEYRLGFLSLSRVYFVQICLIEVLLYVNSYLKTLFA